MMTLDGPASLVEQGSRTQSAAHRAHASIVTSLRKGEMQLGERLVLRPLADRLGLSATPVREALLRLVNEQVLSQDEKSTVIVPKLRQDELNEILELRSDLEGRAAELCAARSDDVLRGQLRKLMNRTIEASKERHPATWYEADTALRVAVAMGANRPTIARLIERLDARLGATIAASDHFFRRNDYIRQQQAMLEAINQQDRQNARAAALRAIDILFVNL